MLEKYLKNIVLLCSTIFFTSCESIKYKDDLGFLASAQANSPEQYFTVNGKPCIDMDGQVGLCAKRIKSDETINLDFEKQQYAYRVSIKCSSETGINNSYDVRQGEAFNFKITPDKFSTLRSFTCIGDVFPGDRNDPISSKFEFRFVVYDSNYTKRESMRIYNYKGRSYLILGQHAKYSIVYDEINGRPTRSWYHREAVVRIHTPDKVKAISESYLMRFNYWGI